MLFSIKMTAAEKPVNKTIKDMSSNGSLKLYKTMPDFTGTNRVVIGYTDEGNECDFADPIADVYSRDEALPTQLYAKWQDAVDHAIRYIATDGMDKEGKTVVVEGGFSDTAVLAVRIHLPLRKMRR